MSMFDRAKNRIAGWAKKAGQIVSTIATGIGNGGVFASLRYALQHGTPGRWANDHREEANHYTGWNYVFIRALCMQFAQADVHCFDSSGMDPHSAVYAKQNRKALRKHLDFAGQCLKEYARGQGAKPLPEDSPLMRLLKRPNPSQSGANFRYERILQLELTGSCLIWNVPNALGLTVERYIIPTCFGIPVLPSPELPKGGWRVDGGMNKYLTTFDSQGFVEMGSYFNIVGAIIPADQVQVDRYHHAIWKDDGYGPLAAGSVWSDTAEQVDISRCGQLKNGIRPSVMVTLPEGMNLSPDDLEEASAALNAKYSGAQNSGKAMLVTAVDVTELGQNGREMDFANTGPQVRDQMQALHNTPGVVVGISTDMTYGALYAGLKGYTLLNVQPKLDMIAESDTHYLAPQFGENITIEYTAKAIDDHAQREAEIKTDVMAGNVRKVNELRALRGLDPLPGPEGEAFAGAKTAGGMGPDSSLLNPDSKPGAPKKPTGQNGKPQGADDDLEKRLANDPVLKAAYHGCGCY